MNRLEKLANPSWNKSKIQLDYDSGLSNKVKKGIKFLEQNGMKTSPHNNGDKLFLLIYAGKNLPDYLRAISTFFKITNDGSNSNKPVDYSVNGEFPKTYKIYLEQLVEKYIN